MQKKDIGDTMRLFKSILIFSLISVVRVSASNDAGTESPFSMGAGARELSLGGSGLAICDISSSPFWNPSRLSRAEHISLSGFYSQLYESDVAYQYLGFVYPTLDYGNFGLGIFRLGINGIEKRDDGNLLLGNIQDERLGFYLAYGRSISKYDMGLALNMEHHSIDQYSTTSSPGLNLSISRQFEPGVEWLKRFSIALNGRNLLQLSSKLADESVSYPISGDLGLALTLLPKSNWNQALTFTAGIRKVADIDPSLSAGLEYDFHNFCFLRGGLKDDNFAAGAGIKYKFVSLDYAFVTRDLGNLHMFNINMDFGMSVSRKREKREFEREREFNSHMRSEMSSHYNSMIQDLINDGNSYAGRNDYEQANGCFERALFLARVNNFDTTEISHLVSGTRSRLDEINRDKLFRQHSASALTEYESKDYVAARYYADMALRENPESAEMTDLIRRIDNTIKANSSREQMIEANILAIDSLLNYGELDEAALKARSISKFAGDNIRVKAAIRKVRFEKFRETANQAFIHLDFDAAMVCIDSALQLFPGHQMCLDLRDRISKKLKERMSRKESTEKADIRKLNDALIEEIDGLYKTGQKNFEKGDLPKAISNWEEVEKLSPGYGAVREYLVSAYKYIGVELYSQNQLLQAIEIWNKARDLDPDNKEVTEFIKRTKTEVEKLNELSRSNE